MAQGKLEEAELVLRGRGARDSLSPRLAYMHARVLLIMDRPLDALERLLAAHRLDPDNAVVLELSVDLLTGLDRAAEAIPLVEELLKTPSARPRHAVTLARLYARLGDHESALGATRGGLRRFGETAGLLRAKGSIHYDAGDTDQALEAYERALELEPESVQALNFVAYTLADLDLDAERAVALASKASELDPESGIVRDTLGWAYFRAGRLDEAVEEIERAIELGETDPVIYEHLGDALEAKGRIGEALAAWEKALEADPGRESVARKIEQALARMRDAEERRDDR
jgi:tetratricopeptide (TPR) repeat protein